MEERFKLSEFFYNDHIENFLVLPFNNTDTSVEAQLYICLKNGLSLPLTSDPDGPKTKPFKKGAMIIRDGFNHIFYDDEDTMNPDIESPIKIPITLWCNMCKKNVKILIAHDQKSVIMSHLMKSLVCPECKINCTLELEHK